MTSTLILGQDRYPGQQIDEAVGWPVFNRRDYTGQKIDERMIYTIQSLATSCLCLH